MKNRVIAKQALLISMLFVSLFSLASSAGAQEAPKATTWIVVRHADREGTKDELNDAGKERAKQLREIASVLRVKHIYSTKFVRTQSTAQPAADKLGLKVTIYDKHDQQTLDKLKEKHKGEVVLIVGHSNTVGPIATRLGGKGDFSVGHDDYDNLFVLTTDAESVQALRLKYGNGE